MPGIDEMIDNVLSKEGGYVNNPADKGGPTKFGITQATLSRFLERAATVDDVRNLDIGTARDIYELRYYRQPCIEMFYANIVANDESQRVFLRGWMARANFFLPQVA